MTTNAKESLGILGVAALHRYCHSVDKNRRFLVDRLDWEEVAASTPEHEERTLERTAVFRAGECSVVCSEPLSDRSLAARYLARHPEGIGAVVLDVSDIDRTFRLIEQRGGTPVTDVQRARGEHGEIKSFAITTPLPDVRFHFVERNHRAAPLPGLAVHDVVKGGKNRFGFRAFDHITSNFETMQPALLWMEHVLGLERFWKIEFHTQSERTDERAAGSGLRSVVMWDPSSGVRFANNEPYRPSFERSQVYLYCEDQRGAGIQHAAIQVGDLMRVVPSLRDRGVRFVHAPAGYYDDLAAHLARAGVHRIEESAADLRQNEILVDGEGEGRYLLQVFMEDAARFEGDLKKSPFFFELIQRKGDEGFGAGNFRALFEGVERAQRGRVR